MTNVLPPPAQVAGKHAPLFEAFYRQLDPSGKGIISAPDGATFLKKSGLSDAILSKIWDLSDPQGKGFLDKSGLYVSLKLVSLAQNGREVDIKSVLTEVPEPQMGERPSLIAVNQLNDSTTWTLTVAETEKYTALFRTLEVAGRVPGAKAKNVMIESKLPVDVLGKIWDLADADKDGALDLTEFVTCMGLLAKAVGDNGRVATSLPKIPLIPSSSSSSGIPPPVNSVLPPVTPPLIAGPPLPPAPTTTTILPPKPQPPLVAIPSSVTPPIPSAVGTQLQQQQQQVPWIVSPEELAKYSVLFTSTDKDRDGYVSGLEIRDVFLQSGIPQPVLAHIWNLCDTDQTGKLSLEQFALAMYFINKKLAGMEPPTALLPNMVPPSLRSAGGGGGGGGGIIPPPAQPLVPVETNPEFELISKEIRELAMEREAMENEIAAKETEKKIKSGEMRSLQTELDTLAATLKQLENQKSVAGAKLGELAAQVDSLRTQADEQEETLKGKEGEVSEKLNEYNSLNEEESSIEKGMKEAQETIEKLGVTFQDTQLSIGQARAKVSNLTELKETMENLSTKFGEVIENGNVYSITEPELVDLGGELTELIGEPEKEVNANFDSNVVNNNSAAFEDPFASSDGSMFVSSSMPAATVFVEEEDPFAALHAPPPLSSSSPWSHPDPFAPVSGVTTSIKHDFSPGKDPFGHEPFSLPEDSPALPPKKPGKAPPPRPAPPKNAPARPPPPKIQSAPPPQQNFADPFGQGDPFGNSSSEVDGGFADFANFDQQFNAVSTSSSSGSPWGSSGTSNTSSSSSRTAAAASAATTAPASSSAWKPSTSTIIGDSSSTTSSSSSFMFGTAALDFTEDPFKNYRYEDPFALADPFQSLAGDPFSQDPQEQEQQQQKSNSHFRSHQQLQGTKPILHNNNNNSNSNNNNNNNTANSTIIINNNNNHHHSASKNAHNKNRLKM